MKRWMTIAIQSLLASCWLLAPNAQAQEVFNLQFRDGSIVKATINNPTIEWAEFEVGRESASSEIPFSRIGSLTLAELPITQRLAAVQKLLGDLSAEDYAVREAATEALREKGSEFVDVISALLESPDPEVRWRVKGIIHSLTGTNRQPVKVDFDQLILTTEGSNNATPAEGVMGDAREFSLDVVVFGKELQIPRNKLVALWRDGYQAQSESSAQVIGERITSDQVDRFPSNSIVIGFGNGPDGSPLVEGTSIDDLYSPWGVRFSTSLDKGKINVFTFSVGGAASGTPAAGGSVAGSTAENYKGVTTIRFHAPNRPDVPATVTMFGCYMALIKPQGTFVRFFDLQGQLISELATTRNNWEFMGFRSPRPIARVEIHPTKLDTNYAIDDVHFDPPQVAAESSNGKMARVGLVDGQQLQAGELEIVDQFAILKSVTIGVAEVKLPLDQINYLAPISDAYDPLQAEPRTWIQTVHGDRVMVSLGNNAAQLIDNREISFPRESVRAIWGSRQADVEVGLAQSSTEPVWLDAESKPYPIQNFAIGDGVLEGLSSSSGWTAPVVGNDSPIVLLGPAPEWDSESAYLRTIDGQLWVLDGDRVKFAGWNATGAVLSISGQGLTIELPRISAVKIPAAN